MERCFFFLLRLFGIYRMQNNEHGHCELVTCSFFLFLDLTWIEKVSSLFLHWLVIFVLGQRTVLFTDDRALQEMST